MKLATPIGLLIIATVFLTWSITATLIAPPVRLDSRDVLVLGLGLTGVVFALLSGRRFLGVHRQLQHR